MMPSRPILYSAVLGMTAACSLAQAEKGALDHADYIKVKSLLAAKCYSCHGALKQKAGLPRDHWSDTLQIRRFCAEGFAEANYPS